MNMNEVLKQNGWYHYASGCYCNGLPLYYKNADYPDFTAVTKAGYGIIRRNGIEFFKTKDVAEFETKIKSLPQ